MMSLKTLKTGLKELGVDYSNGKFTHENPQVADKLNEMNGSTKSSLMYVCSRVLQDLPVKDTSRIKIISSEAARSTKKKGKPPVLHVPESFLSDIRTIVTMYERAAQTSVNASLQEQMAHAIAAYNDTAAEPFHANVLQVGDNFYLGHPKHPAFTLKMDLSQNAESNSAYLQRQLTGFQMVCFGFDTNIKELEGKGYTVVIPSDKKGEIDIRHGDKSVKTILCQSDAKSINTMLRAAIRNLPKVEPVVAVEAVEADPVPVAVIPPVEDVAPAAEAPAEKPPAIPAPAQEPITLSETLDAMKPLIDMLPISIITEPPAASNHNGVHHTNGNSESHPAQGFAPAAAIETNKKVVIVVPDTKILTAMAVRMSPHDPQSSLLGVLEMLSHLPNVTIMIPSTVANFEARGVVEDWNHAGFTSRVVNKKFTADPEFAAITEDLTNFFASAYRVRKRQDGEGMQIIKPLHHPNPHLVIFETNKCREVIHKIDSQSDLSGITRNHIGEQAIKEMIAHEMPFEHGAAVVISEDNEVNRMFKGVATLQKNPIGTGRFSDLMQAIFHHAPDASQRTPFWHFSEALEHVQKRIEALQNGRSQHPSYFRPEEEVGIYRGKTSETLAGMVQRGVLLAGAAAEVESPVLALAHAEKERETTEAKTHPSRLGLLIQSLMDERSISFERLAERINSLNKVHDGIKTPAIQIEQLQGYVSGWTCPDHDTHYALMAALVWENPNMTAQEKKATTEEFMAAWNVRKDLPETLTMEKAKKFARVYANVLGSTMGIDRLETAAYQLTLQERKMASAQALQPLDAESLASMVTLRSRNKPPHLILRMIDALEYELGREIKDDERLALFKAMLDDGRNNAQHGAHGNGNGKALARK